jgi:hypothetical protein
MSQIESPTHAFVTALVGIGGSLVTTIDHMRRHANPAPDADTIPEVLTRILTDIVDSELDHPPDDLYLAAAVLNATCTAMQENLFLVDPDPSPTRPRRPRRRR